MEELIRRRGRIKGKLTRICSFSDQWDMSTITAVDIQIKLDMLSEIWSDFDITQTKIECECQEGDLAVHQQEQEEFEKRFCSVKAKLMGACTQMNRPNNSSGMRQVERPHVKLPAIELPVFAGDYRNWASFADLFQAVVHQNMTLSEVQKLHYLKSSLRGEAAGLIRSMAITDANYLQAWRILSDRYSNRRQVIQSHLRAMYSQAKVTTESAVNLRQLLDVTVENLRALHALDLPTDEWDCLIVFLVTERLDSGTRRHWELSLGEAHNPSFDDLRDFMEKRCRALEASDPERKNTATSARHSNVKSNKNPATVSYHGAPETCVKCKGKHPLYKCEPFRQLSVEQRIELAKSASLCFNCLRTGHGSRECKLSHCKKCQQRHSTLLHRDRREPVNSDTSTDGAVVTSHHSNDRVKPTQVLLATAIVRAKDSSGSFQSIRALLDSGSQATFVTEACVQQLGLVRQKTNITIGGLGANHVDICKGIVQFEIVSQFNSNTYQIQALILRQVTGIMPPHPIDPSYLAPTISSHQLDLADPSYHCPGKIDILLGADIYLDLIQSGRIKEQNHNTILQNTSLGWIVSGPVQAESNHLVILSHVGLQDLNCQLKAFWELEELSKARPLSPEEAECEEHFKRTHTRNKDGRFVVMLPFKNLSDLGDTSGMATRRLLQIEKRLELKPECKHEYNKFMAEYLSLDHMELVSQNDNTRCYHLPHHYVLKESSTTTKLRVVFDGTALPLGGVSLNSTLMVGPTIQPELLDIIMRFRMHNVVLIADIVKMYRQILVHPDHQNYQRIKWRSSQADLIRDYRLKTVTYGTASAPFLAIRCLQQLAIIGEVSHPLASAIIKRDFYVDDLLTGANSILEAQQIQEQLIDLLSSAGLELRKWSSNRECMVENLPKEHLHEGPVMNLIDDSVKTLGVQWHPGSDCFKFTVTQLPVDNPTKRKVISQIAKLFDPLGWLAPVIVCAKIFIQRLWLLGIDWDDHLPQNIAEEWRSYYNELSLLEHILIPRQLIDDSSMVNYQLHAFCDASEAAYGAMILMRSVTADHVTIRLVCAKTKVAPLKKVSLPHLELCGAVILARLLRRVMSTLLIPVERIYAWTDSSVVISWIRRPSHHWKTFVANRISEIQELVPPDRWNHVTSNNNPADCLSRGLSPRQLIEHNLWWCGPSWLSNQESWPQYGEPEGLNDALSELRRPTLQSHAVTTSESTDIISVGDYSSLSRLVRITSYCRRFTQNSRLPRDARTMGFLTVTELQESLHWWVAKVQRESFNTEMQCCINNKAMPTNSSLLSLSPFIDKAGLLRVGGRLQQSLMAYNQKHPLILPHHHALTVLIIRHAHLVNLHAGLQLLQCILRREY